MAIGNIGPKRTPIIETEITTAVKEGTSQTINWKLFTSEFQNQKYNGVRLTKSQGGYTRRWS